MYCVSYKVSLFAYQSHQLTKIVKLTRDHKIYKKEHTAVLFMARIPFQKSTAVQNSPRSTLWCWMIDFTSAARRVVWSCFTHIPNIIWMSLSLSLPWSCLHGNGGETWWSPANVSPSRCPNVQDHHHGHILVRMGCPHGQIKVTWSIVPQGRRECTSIF